MHHLVAMGMVKRIQNLAHDANDLFEIEFLTCVEIVLQLFAADVFHRDKSNIISLAVIVDRDHARVVKPAGGLRLLFESPQQGLGFGPVKRFFRNRFDRHPATNDRVAAVIDRAHRPLAEDADNVILAKFCGGGGFQGGIVNQGRRNAAGRRAM